MCYRGLDQVKGCVLGFFLHVHSQEHVHTEVVMKNPFSLFLHTLYMHTHLYFALHTCVCH